jgi:hypothetical protein
MRGRVLDVVDLIRFNQLSACRDNSIGLQRETLRRALETVFRWLRISEIWTRS